MFTALRMPITRTIKSMEFAIIGEEVGLRPVKLRAG